MSLKVESVDVGGGVEEAPPTKKKAYKIVAETPADVVHIINALNIVVVTDDDGNLPESMLDLASSRRHVLKEEGSSEFPND